MSGADPILEYCAKSYPERPVIDYRETLWKRDELEARIDYWMDLLTRAVK